MSLWEAMNHAFYIQIVGGVALGLLPILMLIYYFASDILCFNWKSTNWTALPEKTQAFVVTEGTIRAYFIQMWTFFVALLIFGWPVIKKLNLLTLNLLCAFFDTCFRLYFYIYGNYHKSWKSYPLNGLFVFIVLMNSFLLGKEIANKTQTLRNLKVKKALKVAAMLTLQFAFGIPLTLSFVYILIPLYAKEDNEILRTIIAGGLPLITAIPKVIVRLAAQRIDFVHPGDSHVLLSVLFTGSAIVFRILQADLVKFKLFVWLSFAHGAVDLLERLTIVVRDYFWYFVYRKLKRDREAEETLRADKFRTPRSMRLIADMSIQMILGESTAMIAAVGFIQLYKFTYLDEGLGSIAEFFIRVSIALSIDFVFNSFSFWLQMSYLNVAVVRVWRKKWRKHMLVVFILTAVTLCYFVPRLFVLVVAKSRYTPNANKPNFTCTEPFQSF